MRPGRAGNPATEDGGLKPPLQGRNKNKILISGRITEEPRESGFASADHFDSIATGPSAPYISLACWLKDVVFS